MKARRAIFFDRDGILNKSKVINGTPLPPESLEFLEINDDIEDLCTFLKSKDYMLFMITNQPDIARGKTKVDTVDRINLFLKEKLLLDCVYCCPHDDGDNCTCRKPLPGMIFSAQSEFNIDLTQSFVIGDRWKDIEAGTSARCKTILVNYNYDEKKIDADFTVNSTSDLKDLFITEGL